MMVSVEDETTNNLIPKIVDFGASIEKMETLLSAICTKVKIREINQLIPEKIGLLLMKELIQKKNKNARYQFSYMQKK